MKRFFLIALTLLLCTAGQAQLIKTKSSSIVTIEGTNYYVHSVKKGDTVYSLARLYGVTEEELLKSNPQAVEGLQPGQVLKIRVTDVRPKLKPKKMARLFDIHTVNQGETAYAISKRYGISVNTLIEDNPGMDPAALSIGQQLNIRKTEQGEASDAQLKSEWEDYRDAINSVSDDYVYHLVAKGETVYSLSRQFGVTQADIMRSNDLKDGLKTGALIRIPNKKKKQEQVAAEQPVQDSVVMIPADTGFTEDDYAAEIPARTFLPGATLNVALMLPLKSESGSGRNFADFYRGVLLGLEDIKSAGQSVNLTVYNTGKSENEVAEIVKRDDFRKSDLIIGPVYEECLPPVLSFARRRGIPVVSPLAVVEKAKSPLLYQMAPDPARKYDKLRDLLTEDKNIVVVSTTDNDREFEQEIIPLLPKDYRTLTYTKNTPVAALEGMIRDDRDNVFVVLSGNEYTVDQILARISSVQNNLVARSIKNAQIRIVGSSRWGRFQNIDKNLYFKLGLHFVTSYHADRSNASVAEFDRRYVKEFGMLPSLYAYRGYDAAKLFVGAASLPGDFAKNVNRSEQRLLQMNYHFDHESSGDVRVNDQWALVRYLPDYTIEVR